MSVDRSTRNALAALLLVAALFVTMNRVVASAPLAEWWLPLLLFILGAALLPDWQFSRAETHEPEAAPAAKPALPAASVHVYSVGAQQAPRLHTMTIRPDPDLEKYSVVTVTDDASGAVLPFVEAAAAPISAATAAPASPETPAPAVVVEPQPEAEPTPASPETPTPSAPPELTVISPETPAPVSAPPELSSADELTRLSGIGPKSAAALKTAGIDSYQKLADSSDDAIRAALVAGGVRLVGDINTWSQQAAYAARGDWAGLDSFKAGRRSENGD